MAVFEECPDQKQMGDNLRFFRERAGYRTRRSFAEAFGMHETTYGNYELGLRSPSYSFIWRFSRFLNVPADEILGLAPRGEATERVDKALPRACAVSRAAVVDLKDSERWVKRSLKALEEALAQAEEATAALSDACKE